MNNVEWKWNDSKSMTMILKCFILDYQILAIAISAALFGLAILIFIIFVILRRRNNGHPRNGEKNR